MQANARNKVVEVVLRSTTFFLMARVRRPRRCRAAFRAPVPFPRAEMRNFDRRPLIPALPKPRPFQSFTLSHRRRRRRCSYPVGSRRADTSPSVNEARYFVRYIHIVDERTRESRIPSSLSVTIVGQRKYVIYG